MVKKTQDIVVSGCLVGGAAAAGACYMGWVKPEELKQKASKVAQIGTNYMSSVLGVKPSADSIKADLSKSKVELSKMAKCAPAQLVGCPAHAPAACTRCGCWSSLQSHGSRSRCRRAPGLVGGFVAGSVVGYRFG